MLSGRLEWSPEVPESECSCLKGVYCPDRVLEMGISSCLMYVQAHYVQLLSLVG